MSETIPPGSPRANLHPQSLHSFDGDFILGWYVVGHVDPLALRDAIGEALIEQWRREFGDNKVQVQHQTWRRAGNQHGARFHYARHTDRGSFPVTVLDFDSLDLNSNE